MFLCGFLWNVFQKLFYKLLQNFVQGFLQKFPRTFPRKKKHPRIHLFFSVAIALEISPGNALEIPWKFVKELLKISFRVTIRNFSRNSFYPSFVINLEKDSPERAPDFFGNSSNDFFKHISMDSSRYFSDVGSSLNSLENLSGIPLKNLL